jgi:TRAP-type mannitol/chloroaromatic compound transport system substrate-binding protein
LRHTFKMNFDSPQFAMMRAQLLAALPLEERKRRGLEMAERATNTEAEMRHQHQPPSAEAIAEAKAKVQALSTKLIAASKSKAPAINEELKAAQAQLKSMTERNKAFETEVHGTRLHRTIGLAAWLDAMETKFPSLAPATAAAAGGAAKAPATAAAAAGGGAAAE